MKKIFKVFYDNKPAGTWDEHGTSQTKSHQMQFTENFLAWELCTDRLTRRWTDMILSYTPNDVTGYTWNFYNNCIYNLETFFSSLEELNQSIDQINEKQLFDCDPGYKLDIDLIKKTSDLTTLSDSELEKLNQIHYIFESVMLKTDVSNDMYKFLERLNSLVHTCEKYFIINDVGNIQDFLREVYFTVIRIEREKTSRKIPHITLEDDDYRTFNFTNEINGSLTLDFATVGKDLSHAAHTNDLALVANDEVKHQLYAKPYVSWSIDNRTFGTTSNQQHEYMQNLIKTWAEENNIEQYGYDYTELRYTPGRHKLGDPLFNFDSAVSIITKNPYVVGIRIEDENGSIIWSANENIDN